MPLRIRWEPSFDHTRMSIATGIEEGSYSLIASSPCDFCSAWSMSCVSGTPLLSLFWSSTSVQAMVRPRSSAQAMDPFFYFTEKPGPYAVGLKVVDQYDFSRTYRPKVDALGKSTLGERARPLQTLIWYPAEKSGKKPLTVGDYSELLASETNFDMPKLWGEWKAWIDGMRPTLKHSLWAVRDAPAEKVKFPLVIYAPSFSRCRGKTGIFANIWRATGMSWWRAPTSEQGPG